LTSVHRRCYNTKAVAERQLSGNADSGFATACDSKLEKEVIKKVVDKTDAT